MLVVVRADATASSGVGHAMRCLALAEEFVASGDDIHWIGDLSSQPWLADKVSSIASSILEPEGSQSAQANQVLEIHPELTIVDSYELGEDFCAPVQQRGQALVAIIDSSSHLAPADMFVLPGTDPVTHDFVGDTPILQGTQYVLIRQELRRVKQERRRLEKREGSESKPMQVSVLLGGTDVAALAPRIVESLISLDVPLTIDASPRPERPPLLSQTSGEWGSSSVTWWSPGEDIYSRVVDADLVISAAGVSSWELLFLDVPLALVQVVDNQASNYEWMTSRGLAFGIGESTSLQDPRDLRNALRDLLESDLQATRSRNTIIDGLGAQRVVHAARQLVTERKS